ncbi:hypothetical protein [Ornithinimicrobium pekingense]|uniref:Permease n=1 Tax=Ornithinimicrobium pekingense TaxID=384677 RepID=A0ABQ2FBD3_9MICO|nr:hypothetical protein [Ornithinimicrobium pekingense]GGK77086.1 hypothetical protein GCM10011509_27160 [Ornithinimicrobium pekingense]
MSPTSRLRPRLAPSAWVTASVGVVVAVLALAAVAAPEVLAFALAAGGAVLAWGWAGTLDLPSPRGTLSVIVVGGLALVLSVATRDGAPWLVWVPAALTIAMIAAFAHQLFRVDGRPRLVQSVSSVVLALALVACGVLLVPPARTPEGEWLVVGALVAAAASSATDLLGRYPALRSWLTALAMTSGGLAAVVVALLAGMEWTTWLLVGVASGALSHAMRAVMAPLPTLALARPRLVAALASVLVVGVVPYLVAQAFVPGALAG